jgi:uncharacterized protein
MNSPIRRARRGTLLLFLITHILLVAIVNLLLFANGVFYPLAASTGGLLTGTLIVGLVMIALLICGVCLRFGKLRPYDIGWIPAHLRTGIIFTLALWAAAQVVHLSAGWMARSDVALAPAIHMQGFGALLGVLVGQLFGNALFEELAYRGFLFPQLYLRIHGSGERPWLRFVITLLISQALFALVHIPNRLYMGMTLAEIAPDLAMLIGWGVLFTLVYLRTDNLFIVTGIHALGNAPTTLFSSIPALQGASSSLLIYALAVLAIFVLPSLLRAFERPAQVYMAEDYAVGAGD